MTVTYRWISIAVGLVSIFYHRVESETLKEKENIMCKQKVLWKMRMCHNGKLICSKNKKYVDKARRYIKALGSPNHARRVKASYKLMKIAHYILPYIKEEYKRVKNLEQINALIGYRSLNLLKDADMKIMCEDGKGGFMWYAAILKGAVKTFAPRGFVSLGFILAGNESGVIGGFQVRGYTKDWKVSNYSCDLRDKSRTKFAIQIDVGGDNYVITGNSYYRNSNIYSSLSKNFYIIRVRSGRGKVKAVINGKESVEYKDIGYTSFPPFSSSSNRYGFVAIKSNGKYVSVIDGKESEEYNRIGLLRFSYTGSMYGFVAQKENGKWVAVIDGKESGEYFYITQISFNSSGSRYGFVAKKENGKWVAVIDGKESNEYNYIKIPEIAFSSSGNRYGFVTKKESGKEVVVIDGKESEEYNDINIWSLVFSSSGNRYGFVAQQKENGKWVAVIDGKESKEYTWVGSIVFSPSDNRYGFVAMKESGKKVVVIDGKESEEYHNINMWSLVFSSSGNRYGFVAQQKENGKWIAVIDGKKSKEYNDINIWSLVFSPSGKRYGFAAQKENGKWVVVIDGKESKEYEQIESMLWEGNIAGYIWSYDDKLFAFAGRIEGIGEEGMCEVVVNNQPIKTTNCTPDFYFHKNTLKFIEFRNNKIYSVSCKLE